MKYHLTKVAVLLVMAIAAWHCNKSELIGNVISAVVAQIIIKMMNLG